MKRIFLATAGASLLAICAPGAALAHHARHRSACSARAHRHHAHCAHARVLRFGAATTASSGTVTGATSGAPHDAPPSGEPAGKVKSFTGGVLTITLTDGTEVSGKVTENTELECESATPPT